MHIVYVDQSVGVQCTCTCNMQYKIQAAIKFPTNYLRVHSQYYNSG